MIQIYALREAGSTEARYIGRSAKPLHLRLRKHRLNAAHNYPPRISAWINSSAEIEIVPLVAVPDDFATITERALVERYLAAGHRLTNSHLVPTKGHVTDAMCRGFAPCTERVHLDGIHAAEPTGVAA